MVKVITAVRSVGRWLAPNGILELCRQRRALRHFGIAAGPRSCGALTTAMRDCRYELWGGLLPRSDGLTVVDVGANTGRFVNAVSQLRELRRVHLVEPLPSCVRVLAMRYGTDPRVTIHACAAGAQEGQVVIHSPSSLDFASVLQPCQLIAAEYGQEAYEVRNEWQVPCRCIDSLLQTPVIVDLLKIDVQGMELEVLGGARVTLANTRLVLVEANYVRHYYGAAHFDSVYNRLIAEGFKLRGVSAPMIGRSGPLWADALFCRQPASTA